LVDEAQCAEEGSEIDPSAVCGDMPRNSKVGYLFAENAGDQASFNRTVAHELGHGAFAYEHPFDNAAYKTEQGTTHNLMDYVKDDDLAYFQWQSTLGLNLTWGFLEGDEDGLQMLLLTEKGILAEFVYQIHKTNKNSGNTNHQFKFDCPKLTKLCPLDGSSISGLKLCNILVSDSVYINQNYYHIKLETVAQKNFSSIPIDTIYYLTTPPTPPLVVPDPKIDASAHRNCPYLDSVSYEFGNYRLIIRGDDAWNLGRYMFGPFCTDGTIHGDPFPSMEVTVTGSNSVKGYWGCVRTKAGSSCPSPGIRAHYTARPGKNRPHDGYDITAAVGTNIHAIRGGEVVKVENSYQARNNTYRSQNNRDHTGAKNTGGNCGCHYSSGYGNTIIIKTKEKVKKCDGSGVVSDSFYVKYAHLNTVSVQVGNEVTEGQIIGTSGCSGNAAGYAVADTAYYHLHIESTTKVPVGNTFVNLKRDVDVLDLFSTKLQKK
ncbi:MAG: M23 family metallopeptidase, partial [Paludibacteraceae bacterium]|nr:M23 family metallopeptidase [Paludibacteraceae bacterium]